MGWVRGLAHRLVSDPGLADDVTQDTWLAARSAPGQLEGEGAERAWLATVVRNLVAKSARSRARRSRREEVAARTESTASVADVVERGAMHQELTGCVMSLDEPYRTAVLLRYLDGLSTGEVAKRQGISPAAARKRLSRANVTLRDMLDDSHGGDRRAWSVPLVAMVQTASKPGLNAAALSSSAIFQLIVTHKFIVAALALALASFFATRLKSDTESPPVGDVAEAGTPRDVTLVSPDGPAPLKPETNTRVAARPSEDSQPTVAKDSRSGWVVTLVDEEGAPIQGGHVDLLLQTRFGDMLLGKKIAMAGPTDGDGKVFVENTAASIPSLRHDGMELEVADVQLVPAGLFGASSKPSSTGALAPAVSVSPEETSPPVKVTLVRPDSGSVRIDVRSSVGVLPEGFRVLLTEGVTSFMTGTVQSCPLPPGSPSANVTFQGIGLGRNLEVQIRSQGGAILGKSSLPGPTLKGEKVAGEVELVAAHPIVRGRVLGLTDQPLTIDLRGGPSASRTLRVGKRRQVMDVTVDGQGRFEVEAPWLRFPVPVFAQLSVHETGTNERAFEPNVLVEPGTPVVDLGEFELGPIPVAIGGRVIDEQGKGVMVTLEVSITPDPTSGAPWGRVFEKLISADDGSFALKGQLPPGEVQLLLKSETHTLPGGEGTVTTFPVGSDDVNLVVSSVGWLQVDASGLPDGFHSHFHLRTHRSDLGDEGKRASRQIFVMSESGKLGPVGSGLLQVELQAWGIGTVGSWDILLPAGETYDLGTLVPDRVLSTHTVIIDTDQEGLDPRPRIVGRTAHRIIAARADRTGRRHTFVTTEPIETVWIGPRHGETPESEPVEHAVTGHETRLGL